MRAPCRWRLMTSLCFVGVITFPLIAGSGRSVLSGSVPIGFVFTIAFGRRPPSAIFAEGVVRCIIRITLIYDGNVRAKRLRRGGHPLFHGFGSVALRVGLGAPVIGGSLGRSVGGRVLVSTGLAGGRTTGKT